MKSNLKLLTIVSLFIASLNAQNNMELKFNFGMAFNKPIYDLPAYYGGNKTDLQPHVSLEGKIIRVPFGKEAQLGAKLTAVAGMEWANLLANDRLTKVKVSMPHLKARIYPLSTDGSIFEYIDNSSNNSILWGIVQVVVINSLHFDYGVSFAKLEEDSFDDVYYDEDNFESKTIKRTMTYTGWGIQPQIFQSVNEKWIWNAFFDFGKYKWENEGGGTSGLKTNNLGFGFRYNF